MNDVSNYSLLEHNTFGINVKCDRFVEFSSVDELKQTVLALSDNDKPLLFIGAGSNLLLTGDYHGTVLHSAIKGVEAVADGTDNMLIRCGSGEIWDDIAAQCVENGWYGTENLSLIPGEVGASAVQNIGAYGVEIKDLIVKVEAVEIATGKVVEFSNADCKYSYRQSKFKNEWRGKYVITYVTYRLSKAFTPHLDYGNIRVSINAKGIVNPTAVELREIIIEIRNAKLPDPKMEGNAGSFFMNPIVSKSKYEELVAQYPSMPHYTIDEKQEKIPAGWMIDQCGWKGRSLGPACVHPKQALVLVNKGGANGEDIVLLYMAIRKDVLNKFGIEINPEVNVI